MAQLPNSFVTSPEFVKARVKANQCIRICQHIAYHQGPILTENLALDLMNLPDDEIEKVFNCLPPGNPLEGLSQEALIARNERVAAVWEKSVGDVCSFNLDKFRFLVKELGLGISEVPRENWKAEGRCPQCGELGPFLRGAPCCSKHGPYWF